MLAQKHRIWWLSAALLASACRSGAGEDEQAKEQADEGVEPQQPAAEQAQAKEPEAPPPPPGAPMVDPVSLWEKGGSAREVDAATATASGHLVLDLGEAWTPYIFSEGNGPDGEPRSNAYRETYLALAAGQYPDNHHGERAQNDKYLELYGIMPTLSVLRERFRQTADRKCDAQLDLTPLVEYAGLVTYGSNDAARKQAADFAYLRNQVKKYLKKQKVEDVEQLDFEKLDDREKDRVRRYKKFAPDWFAVNAAQERLKCEGYFKDRGRFVRGALDWATHDALAEFERRHRVYSWGYLGRDTLDVLRMSPMEAERQALIRVLLERAIHASGVIEDGSVVSARTGKPHTYKGADGKDKPVPNLVGELEQRIIEAFGLQTPERTLSWLESLGELPAGGQHRVAIAAPELPDYYDGDMDLVLEYDRGDVWYDFPYDAGGRELAQPVQRRPRVLLSVRYEGQKIALSRFGTTIGGWRSEQVGESVMWRYKDSPVGTRVWSQIVASPVWLPPDSTPARDLLKRKARRKKGEPKWEVNYHETGPSYASAYGLVAAYHRKFLELESGAIRIGGDEGIRTHGSVDYMSIMRRHSHGCHRLHNHIAVRLMSFVLAHRPHKRLGQQPVAFKKTIEYEEETYEMDISRGGYVFELHEPLKVHVLEGRIRGKVKQPIEFHVPKFNDEIGAYVTPDGGAVEVRGDRLVEVPMPEPPDAGVLMGAEGEVTTVLPPVAPGG